MKLSVVTSHPAHPVEYEYEDVVSFEVKDGNLHIYEENPNPRYPNLPNWQAKAILAKGSWASVERIED